MESSSNNLYIFVILLSFLAMCCSLSISVIHGRRFTSRYRFGNSAWHTSYPVNNSHTHTHTHRHHS